MTDTSMAAPARILPVVDRDSEAFWTWGRDGRLAIHRCQKCAYYDQFVILTRNRYKFF